MTSKKKFAIGIAVIVLTMTYLGITGFQQDYAYYLTADEFMAKVQELGDTAYTKNFRIAGQVVMGSIDRNSRPMTFEIDHNDTVIPITYVGKGPVPDTFKDHAQTVVAGQLGKDGVFRADKIQAKCASKYEAMAEETGTDY